MFVKDFGLGSVPSLDRSQTLDLMNLRESWKNIEGIFRNHFLSFLVFRNHSTMNKVLYFVVDMKHNVKDFVVAEN